jgi:hypothetical protein
MQYYDSVAKHIHFNNQFGNPISGIPLTTCIKNEQKKMKETIGGGLNNDTTDNFSRLDGLVIPMGLYTQQTVDGVCRNFKKSKSAIINDELFENLFEIVTKNKVKKNKTIKNKPANNNKTKRNFSFF